MSLLKTNELQKPRPFSCKVAGQRPMTSPLRTSSVVPARRTLTRLLDKPAACHSERSAAKRRISLWIWPDEKPKGSIPRLCAMRAKLQVSQSETVRSARCRLILILALRCGGFGGFLGLGRFLGLGCGRAGFPVAAAFGFARRLRGRLPGVVGDVPAAALELNGRRGEQLLEFAAALFAGGEGRVREFHDLLEARAALQAPILIKRQAALLPPTAYIIAGRSQESGVRSQELEAR